MFFKTNYIWILLQYVTFHVQVEISLHVMSPTLESFNSPFMRLCFYAAFIQIEFGSSIWSFLSNYTIKYLYRRSHAFALWKFWVCEYSIRFHVMEIKLLCETLKNWILVWYPNKMRWYCLQNPKCGDWRWTNFQMQVAWSAVLLKTTFPFVFSSSFVKCLGIWVFQWFSCSIHTFTIQNI